jgi:hypothetical protein
MNNKIQSSGISKNQGSFSVQSTYKNLVNELAMPLNKEVWKLKLSLKVKVFIWFFFKGVILTKDNLVKHNCIWFMSTNQLY